MRDFPRRRHGTFNGPMRPHRCKSGGLRGARMLPPMTLTRSRADLLALAARLQGWVLALALWLAAHLRDGPLARALARWTRGELARAEAGAVALCTLLALLRVEMPPEPRRRRGRRPMGLRRGLRQGGRRGPDLRALARRLFPRHATLAMRVRRLAAVLHDPDRAAARLRACLERPVIPGAPVLRADAAQIVAGFLAGLRAAPPARCDTS